MTLGLTKVPARRRRADIMSISESLEPRRLFAAYVITDLGTLGGAYSFAYDINNTNQVVGYAQTDKGVDRGFIFKDANNNHLADAGEMMPLGVLSGQAASAAYGINDSGQAVGLSRTTSIADASGVDRAASFTSGGAATDLGLGDGSNARGINSTGQIVGGADNGGTYEAYLKGATSTTFFILGSGFDSFSEAHAVNGSGAVTGYSSGGTGDQAFIRSTTGTLSPIGFASPAGLLYNYGNDINASGVVAGEGFNPSGNYRAFKYNAGAVTDLNTLSGFGSSEGYGINSGGQVVGRAEPLTAGGRNHAVLFSDAPHDLNSLIPTNSGWVLNEARAINDNGFIVGFGTNPSGKTHAFLLSPAATPVASPGGPYTVSEGGSLQLSAAGSSDPGGATLTYSWDLNNDNTFGDATGVNPTLTWAQLQALGIKDGPSSFSVRVRVDNGTAQVISIAATLTVTNTSPTLATPSDQAGNQGIATSFNLGSFTDPGAVDGPWNVNVNWGDGTAPTTFAAAAQGALAAQQHVYANTGLFTATIGVTDKDGGVSTPATFKVTVHSPQFVGTQSADTYYVRLSSDSTKIEVFESVTPGPMPMYALPTSSITSLFFDTQGDEDTLIIDLSNGNPIPSGGITYAAGSQGNGGDLLGVIGASGKTTFSVAAAQVLVGTRAVNFTSVEQIQIKSGAGDDQLTLAAGIPASTTFSLGAGSNTFNLTGGAYALAADVNAASGALAINVTGATTKLTVNSTEHLSALSISSGARVVLGTASSHAARFRLVTNALSIDATSGLDLAGNDMIVKSGSIAAIEALLARGFNGGDWKGTGLTSSAVANDASFATALGAAAAGDLDIHSFDGESVASADVLVKYTWYGDADLNGAVNGDDESLCLYGLRQGGAPLWAFGDFDYSAHVNGDDYSLFLYGLKNQKAVL